MEIDPFLQPKKKVQNIVVDSGPLIKGCSLHELGDNFYIVPEVISEIKDKATRHRLEALPYEFKQRSIPPEIIKIVTDFSKKTGDYASLSHTDILVISLTYLLEKELKGTEHLNNEPFITEVNPQNNKISKEMPLGFWDKDKEDEEDGWITSENLSLDRENAFESIDEELPSVACLTTDYAMQNVLMQMGLKVLSVEGMIIKNVRTYILRCHACFQTTSIMTKVFCPTCGNRTLKKVGVSINDDGSKNLHINFKKPINTRGTIFSIPAFKGGKHSNDMVLVEDQRIPENKLSKKALQKFDYMDPHFTGKSDNPFVIRDLHSRAAMNKFDPKKNRNRRKK